MGTRASGGLAVVDVDDSGDDEFVTDVVDVAAEDVRIFTCPLVCAAAVALVAAPVETSVIGAVFFGLDEDVCVADASGRAPELLICKPTDRVVLTGGTRDWLRPFDC